MTIADCGTSHNTINGLGKRLQRIQKVRAFCAREPDAYSDVIELLPESDPESNIPASETSGSKITGYVYLMKSGKFYKIGHSVCAEKRHYEIAIQLPEELKLSHKIATDDPTGIEAYWHKRFADKRKKGEWFELRREDVKVFKRRSYM